MVGCGPRGHRAACVLGGGEGRASPHGDLGRHPLLSQACLGRPAAFHHVRVCGPPRRDSGGQDGRTSQFPKQPEDSCPRSLPGSPWGGEGHQPKGVCCGILRGSGGREHIWKQQHQPPSSICLVLCLLLPPACVCHVPRNVRRSASRLKSQEPVQLAHPGRGVPGDQEALVTDTQPGLWAVWGLQSPSVIRTCLLGEVAQSWEKLGSVCGDGRWLCCFCRNVARWVHCLLRLETVRPS